MISCIDLVPAALVSALATSGVWECAENPGRPHTGQLKPPEPPRSHLGSRTAYRVAWRVGLKALGYPPWRARDTPRSRLV